MQIVVAILVGLAGGGLGGLVGLGGGFVMVPLFIYVFGMSQHVAQGTALSILVLPVALPSAFQYWRAGHVDVRVAALAAVGFVVGGWLGGGAAQLVGGPALRRMFAALLIVIALDLIRR
jgi:uncharacterized membrane protein YfcA